eukprot:CAMPEP_0176449384 /NCGR_PEP_ID=MMETSP0127-20121128/26433_1 /TAXON_ID=938130 /ORGANISM="Platyophrya macrostoma, Strain WH" /LENGTH=44 /DNA_ID= /DNA_START= /DNA_END= /DNA_ORIENTATION=
MTAESMGTGCLDGLMALAMKEILSKIIFKVTDITYGLMEESIKA